MNDAYSVAETVRTDWQKEATVKDQDSHRARAAVVPRPARPLYLQGAGKDHNTATPTRVGGNRN